MTSSPALVQGQLFNQVTSWQVIQVATILVCLEPGDFDDIPGCPGEPGEHLTEGIARLLSGERVRCCRRWLFPLGQHCLLSWRGQRCEDVNYYQKLFEDHMIIVDIGIIGRIHAETSLLDTVHIAFRNSTCSSTYAVSTLGFACVVIAPGANPCCNGFSKRGTA